MFAHIIPTRRTPLSLPFFDYLVPSELEASIRPGQLVTIPFRNRDEFGVVKSVSKTASMNVKNIKPIKNIVHEIPFLREPEMAFLEEIATLYHTSPGFVVEMMLPPLKKTKLTKLQLTTNNEQLTIGKKFTKPNLYIYQDDKDKQKFLTEAISQNGQTLIIVPEKFDVETLTNLLPTSYKLPATTITSDLGDKDLFDRWFAIWSGETKVIVGTRAALFMSFYNLQTVIVDDEGNSGHKSWDMAPRLHARDAATYLAKHHGAALSLMTHTPSVESFYFAKHGVYSTIGDDVGANGRSPLHAQTTIIDTTNERRGGNRTNLSLDVIDRIRNHTEGFIFLFLNRRGSGGYVSCRDCDTVLVCKNCGRSYTYHQKTNTLNCHFCKINEPMATSCAKCGGINISVFGAGTEQVEKEVKKIVDDTMPVYRFDSDVVVGARHALPLPGDGKGIIIATELGWHQVPWNKTSTIIFVDPDAPLFIPEYKATEDLWQTLNDARYRLSPIASMLIQTRHPEHVVFEALAKPELFYDIELKQRKVFGYPPYHSILKLFFGHFNAGIARSEAAALHRKLAALTKNMPNCTISSPLDTSPSYHQKKHWQALIIKVPYSHYKRDIRTILRAVPDTWKVDVNPNTLLGW